MHKYQSGVAREKIIEFRSNFYIFNVNLAKNKTFQKKKNGEDLT